MRAHDSDVWKRTLGTIYDEATYTRYAYPQRGRLFQQARNALETPGEQSSPIVLAAGGEDRLSAIIDAWADADLGDAAQDNIPAARAAFGFGDGAKWGTTTATPATTASPSRAYLPIVALAALVALARRGGR